MDAIIAQIKADEETKVPSGDITQLSDSKVHTHPTAPHASP